MLEEKWAAPEGYCAPEEVAVEQQKANVTELALDKRLILLKTTTPFVSTGAQPKNLFGYQDCIPCCLQPPLKAWTI